MTHGFDTTFLVAWEVAVHSDHGASRSLLSALQTAGDDFAIAPQVLAEFVHVVTDGRRFSEPLSTDAAISRAEIWWNSDEVRQVLPNTTSMIEFFAWMRQHRLGRKRILDTLLAATYKAAGISSVLTINAGDFAVFGHFELRMPGSGVNQPE
jgi:predicted nucleic acid-binding protein